jgi:hypothetical protein
MLLFMYAMPRGVVGSLGPWFARSMQRIRPRRAAFDDSEEQLKGRTL